MSDGDVLIAVLRVIKRCLLIIFLLLDFEPKADRIFPDHRFFCWKHGRGFYAGPVPTKLENKDKALLDHLELNSLYQLA